MKKIFTLIFLMAISVNLIYAQPRANIFVQKVTPYDLKYTSVLFGDSTITTGDRNFPKGTYIYVNVQNIGDATVITNASWTLLSKPTGSNAVISPITGLNWWAKIKGDSSGTYNVKVTMTTSSGSKDTTMNVYAATYVGTGGFAGIDPVYPNCMSCHGSMSQFTEIFDRWKVSGHANWFRYNIDSGSSSYGISCFKCHTTGYDKNIVANNNGFDDNARRLGWVWSNYSPPKPGNWDTIKTRFPGLVPFASIGCENCHGPGSEHVASVDTNKIAKNYKADVCGQCHDSPQNHPNYAQWKNALHSKVIWSSGFAQQPTSADFGTNSLGNCIRCHDAYGYINFTKGIGTDTKNMTLASQNMISCQACHDQHGNSNDKWLRNRPANSDTLATGFHYSLGKGNTCADCHKARKNINTYINTRVTSSSWGPHHGPQSDVLLGKNAASFNGIPYMSGSHGTANQDACVDCHMAPIDTAANIINKVGGHSLNMHNDSLNYDFVKPCKNCHAEVNSHFSDIMATVDYDGNGQIQSWQQEIAGTLRNLRIALPPAGVDSVSWQLIAADSNNVNLRKAYWNYLLITEDKSGGLHNPFFAINVLLSSIGSLIGIEYQWTEIPKTFTLSQNYPNPFNPTTKFTFSIPKTQQVKIKIYDIMGREVKTLVDNNITVGKYTVSWDGSNNRGLQTSSGVYFYRMETAGFVDVKKMVLVR